MLSGRCTNHPDRTAIGVCVQCRTPICIECSTPIEGIHRCARCLAGMEAAGKSRRFEGRELHPLTLLIVFVGAGLLTLAWSGLAALVG